MYSIQIYGLHGLGYRKHIKERTGWKGIGGRGYEIVVAEGAL